MNYSDYIAALRTRWIGQPFEYNGEPHTIVDVDYNGAIHIDLPGKYNPTTAVAFAALDRILPPDFGFPRA